MLIPAFAVGRALRTTSRRNLLGHQGLRTYRSPHQAVSGANTLIGFPLT